MPSPLPAYLAMLDVPTGKSSSHYVCHCTHSTQNNIVKTQTNCNCRQINLFSYLYLYFNTTHYTILTQLRYNSRASPYPCSILRQMAKTEGLRSRACAGGRRTHVQWSQKKIFPCAQDFQIQPVIFVYDEPQDLIS